MRLKSNPQQSLNLFRSHLKITNEYYAKYEAISTILNEVPELVEKAHRDLDRALKSSAQEDRRGRAHVFTAENVLRVLVCQAIEGESLRAIVIRIDDSAFLRQFVRLAHGPMMDYTTLCKLKNSIREETWLEINRCLAEFAVRRDALEGKELRIDTTAVETDIHYPTDSSLLWDVYRVLARLIENAREIDPEAGGSHRLQTRRVKSLSLRIGRKAASKRTTTKQLKPLYGPLIRQIERVSSWALSVGRELVDSPRLIGPMDLIAAASIAQQIEHYTELGARVTDQARRRVLDGESVPNDEKIFSIFEPHTELLKRGKADKPIEFGHMIQIQQIPGKLITDYAVFARKPSEPELLEAALESHKKLFGQYPDNLAADKGYYGGREALDELCGKIAVVSIAKKGGRTAEETAREHDPLFRHGQRFRAGVEGTISYLKRVLRLTRCFNKGWDHFVTTISQSILAHNLMILARG